MPNELQEAGISWVIIGSQTRPTLMPKLEWVEEIVQAADKAGIPVFQKDNLRSLILGDDKTFYDSQFVADAVGHLRQEMPK